MTKANELADQAAAWDAQVPTWLRFDDIVEAGYRALSDRMIAHADLAPGEKVLEVACGTGALAKRIQDVGADVMATDLSPAMVEAARDRGIDAQVMDADGALAVGTWDAVVSRMGAFFFPDPDAWLQAVHAALHPSGRIVLGLWGHPHEVPLVAITDAVARESFDLPDPPRTGIHRPGGPDVWPGMLEAAGFVDVRSEAIEVATPFGTPEAAVTFLRGLAGDLSGLGTPDQIQWFWDSVRVRIPMDQGVVRSRAVVVSGRRAGRSGDSMAKTAATSRPVSRSRPVERAKRIPQ